MLCHLEGKVRRVKKVEALVLAAGLSSRMHQNKLLLPLYDKTVIENTILNLLQVPVDGISVVLGNEKERVRRQLESYPVKFIENPCYARGMSTSVREGVKEVSRGEADAVLILPGDMPFVQPETVKRLIRVFYDGEGSIVFPLFNGKRGHPVLFGKEIYPQFMDISGDMGGREILKRNADRICPVLVDDPGVFIDIDCRDDYDRVLSRIDSID